VISANFVISFCFLGFKGIFKKKVAEDAKDGCALFYKTDL